MMPSLWLQLTGISFFVGTLFGEQIKAVCGTDDARLMSDVQDLMTQESNMKIYLACRFPVRDVAATRPIGIELAKAILGDSKRRGIHLYDMAQVCDQLVCDALDKTRDDKTLDGATAILEEMEQTLSKMLDESLPPEPDDPHKLDALELSERVSRIFFPEPKEGPKRLYCFDGRYICAADKPEAKQYLKDAFGLIAQKVQSVNLKQHMADGRPFAALIEGINATPCFVGVEGVL